MQSKSFGQWYQDRKKEPTSQSIRNSWMSSILGSEENGGDLESASLLSRARNVGAKVTEVSETMKEVLMLFGVAVIFFVIAYFVGLPTLLFRPAKFTISFTMGSIMTLAALARLKGVTAFFKSIMAADRKVQSSLYLISFIDLLRSDMEELCVDGGVFSLPNGDVGSVRDGIVPRRCSHNPGVPVFGPQALLARL